MKTLGAYQAKTHLSKILDAVESGEEVVITRNGKPVAVLKPYPADQPDLLEQIRTYRRRHGIARLRITLEEIADFKAEGRK